MSKRGLRQARSREMRARYTGSRRRVAPVASRPRRLVRRIVGIQKRRDGIYALRRRRCVGDDQLLVLKASSSAGTTHAEEQLTSRVRTGRTLNRCHSSISGQNFRRLRQSPSKERRRLDKSLGAKNGAVASCPQPEQTTRTSASVEGSVGPVWQRRQERAGRIFRTYMHGRDKPEVGRSERKPACVDDNDGCGQNGRPRLSLEGGLRRAKTHRS